MATRKSHGLRIFSVDNDKVVKALVATGRTNYRYAIDHLAPLVNRLEIQRKIQNPRFYERLKRDLYRGCLMPPITLAFVRKSQRDLASATAFEEFVNANISKAFVLDGIQRLSTLNRAFEEDEDSLPLEQPLFVNILVCKSMDNLLYRMITLNNGQRPMTTRHQIEILSANLFKVDDGNISLSTEKQGIRKQHGIFAQADFVLGYMAFLSNSTTVDSQKLIQEKLDELVANKILENDPTQDGVEFNAVTDLIAKFCEQPELDRWFKVSNNLIGFCAGAKQGYEAIKDLEPNEFADFVQTIEEGLRAFDVSKIKLGRTRRNAVAYCIRHADNLLQTSTEDVIEQLLTIIDTDA